jgi:hypothetical protein
MKKENLVAYFIPVRMFTFSLVVLAYFFTDDNKQLPENLSRKGCAPIIREPRGVTWGADIFVVFYSGDHPYADPQTALSR